MGLSGCRSLAFDSCSFIELLGHPSPRTVSGLTSDNTPPILHGSRVHAGLCLSTGLFPPWRSETSATGGRGSHQLISPQGT